MNLKELAVVSHTDLIHLNDECDEIAHQQNLADTGALLSQHSNKTILSRDMYRAAAMAYSGLLGDRSMDIVRAMAYRLGSVLRGEELKSDAIMREIGLMAGLEPPPAVDPFYLRSYDNPDPTPEYSKLAEEALRYELDRGAASATLNRRNPAYGVMRLTTLRRTLDEIKVNVISKRLDPIPVPLLKVASAMVGFPGAIVAAVSDHVANRKK